MSVEAVNQPGLFYENLTTSEKVDHILFQQNLTDLLSRHSNLNLEAVGFRDRKTKEVKYRIKVYTGDSFNRKEISEEFNQGLTELFQRVGNREVPQVKIIGSKRFQASVSGHSVIDKSNRWVSVIGEPMSYVKKALEAESQNSIPQLNLTLKNPEDLLPNIKKNDPSIKVISRNDRGRWGKGIRYGIAGTAAAAAFGLVYGALANISRSANVAKASSSTDCRVQVNIDTINPKSVGKEILPGETPEWVKEMQRRCATPTQQLVISEITSISSSPNISEQSFAAPTAMSVVLDQKATPTPDLKKAPTIEIKPSPINISTPVVIEDKSSQTKSASLDSASEPKPLTKDEIFEEFLDQKFVVHKGMSVWNTLEIPKELLNTQETEKGYQIGSVFEEDLKKDLIIKISEQQYKLGRINTQINLMKPNQSYSVREILGGDEGVMKLKDRIISTNPETFLGIN